MSIELVDIIDVKPEWQTQHQVKVLSCNGRSPAAGGLTQLRKHNFSEYKKILKVIQMVAESERVRNEQCVKQGKVFKNIYEMRGGQARLFFFYSPDSKQVVICTNYYLKSKASKSEQNAAFERAEALRVAYLESI